MLLLTVFMLNGRQLGGLLLALSLILFGLGMALGVLILEVALVSSALSPAFPLFPMFPRSRGKG